MLTEKNSTNLIRIGIGLSAIGLITFLWNFKFISDEQIDSEKIGQFGDYFGGIIGSIWSLAGVILFYVALQEQRKDIEINRTALEKQIEEFSLQRVELNETRKIFEEQSETLKVQRFENTFFQLLNLHHEIVNNLYIEIDFYRNTKSRNREVFKESVSYLKEAFREYHKISEVNTETGQFETIITHDIENISDVQFLINREYSTFFFTTTNQSLSHYFRSLYHIFKFIHKSELIDEEKKQFYATLLRAQLSSDELYLILYNSINPDLGNPNFLFLIKRFDILQNFDFGIFHDFKNHENIFKIAIDNLVINDI